jgi:solute carrier family 25, member 38
MQLQPESFGTVRKAVMYIWVSSGPSGFFLGLAPRILRRTMMAALAWTVYEGAMKKIGIK